MQMRADNGRKAMIEQQKTDEALHDLRSRELQTEDWEKEFDGKYQLGCMEEYEIFDGWTTSCRAHEEIKSYIRSLLSKTRREAYSSGAMSIISALGGQSASLDKQLAALSTHILSSRLEEDK